jgi:hypothetical protein
MLVLRAPNPLSSPSLRSSKEGRLGFFDHSLGLFQHLGNLFVHDIHHVLREQIVARAFDLLPDRIPAHRIVPGGRGWGQA